jgi:single-stranded-DNA-specific exonuclease
MLELNRRRQDLTALACDGAISEIGRSALFRDRIIVLYLPETHESICGIVAGKLKDKYARPVIVFTDSASGYLKGSGRSIEGFDLLGCVKAAGRLLEKYGGHKMAVGIMIESGKLPLLRAELNDKCDIDDDQLVPKERVDICVEPCDIAMELVGDISRLEPFGRGNEKPVLALKGLQIESASLIGSRRNVVKMRLRDGAPRGPERPVAYRQPIEAVFFGDVGLFAEKLGLEAGPDGVLIYMGSPAVTADVTFFVEINDYNGVRKVQLIIRSIRKSMTG